MRICGTLPPKNARDTGKTHLLEKKVKKASLPSHPSVLWGKCAAFIYAYIKTTQVQKNNHLKKTIT